MVRAESSDVGDINAINPPSDSEYDILLALPQLFDPSVTTVPERKPQHYQIYVSAEVAALLEAITDEDPWPQDAIDAANEGLPGDALNRDIVTLYRGDVTSTRTWDGVLDQWVSFQGFIGGNLLVTGGVIAEHIAFIEASGTNIRANTLEVQAANVIGRLTADQIDARHIEVNALNITGRISSSQLDEKVRAPFRLSQSWTGSLLSIDRNTKEPSSPSNATVLFNTTYPANKLSTFFRWFRITGRWSAEDTDSPNGMAIEPNNIFYDVDVPVGILYDTGGIRTTHLMVTNTVFGQRLVTDYVPNSQWEIWAPVIMEVRAHNAGSTRGALRIRIGSTVGEGWFSTQLNSVYGVWRE